ncbi:MAG: type II toxin-antitoxin system RelE/ParE family toxin [Acidobacteriia bacterium]|nr:type II toxin-antitoxin system RelE/ParE family toxin [Terriglobia bacterium]
MRSKQFRFHPEARQDFRDAIGWYSSRSPTAAKEFRKTVSDVIRHLVQAPWRWPKYCHGTRRFVLHRFPFSIIYLDDPDMLSIVALAHNKRKPGYWKQRL